MKRRLFLTFSLAALLMAVFALALVVYAQGPGDQKDEDRSGVIEGQGLGDPAPEGFTVLYTFSGVRDNYNTSQPNPATAATSIHCTNASETALQLRIEFFRYQGNLSNPPYTGIISPNHTLTISTQNTTLYAEDDVITPTTAIDQGSGRIMVNNSAANVICTAQVLDPTGSPPGYVVNLDLFKP